MNEQSEPITVRDVAAAARASVRVELLATRFLLTVVLAGVLLTLDMLTPLALDIWFLQVILVWVTSLWATRIQIIAAGVVCSISAVVAFWLTPKTGEVGIYALDVLLGVAGVWAITQTTLRQKSAEEARARAAEELARSQAEIKVLTGFLPICSSCKKIRNESGAWEQLEAYISSHSEAQFSHSLCLPCMARLYPDLIECGDSGEAERTFRRESERYPG